MAGQSERGPIPLSAIHINLNDRSLIFIAQDFSATKLTLAPEGLIYQAFPPGVLPGQPTEQLPSSAKEKDAPIILTGRLKTQPKEGRADSRGNPTTWARLAVHEEGREDAHIFSATFHKHTAKIALSLPKEAQVTVQGYRHLNEDPGAKRLDTLSVINIVSYPGKPDTNPA